MTENSSNRTPLRRQVLQEVAGLGALSLPGLLTAVSDMEVSAGTPQQSEDVLYSTDFESTMPGNTPPGWTAHGNSNTTVTESVSASGGQSLWMTGSSGACWETVTFGNIGENTIPDGSSSPSTDTVEISFSIRLGGQAQAGCHDHNSTVRLNTDNSPTYGRESHRLIKFRPNGDIISSDGFLGTYDVGPWINIFITYTRQDSDQVVVFSLASSTRRRRLAATFQRLLDRRG